MPSAELKQRLNKIRALGRGDYDRTFPSFLTL